MVVVVVVVVVVVMMMLMITSIMVANGLSHHSSLQLEITLD